jgi:aryl-alcohol dehydrogenase-like predicted oxidoreductase
MDETPLGTTLLSRTGLDVACVGFGAWAIGGGGESGRGPQDDDDSIAAIHHGFDLGINWIDTAAAHGFGRSEQTVGRALHGLRNDERPYPYAERAAIGVIVHSPMASGLLTGAMTRSRIARLPEDDRRTHDPRCTEARLSSRLLSVERMRRGADRHATTPGAVAVARALGNPAVDGAVVGFRRPGQVDPLVGAPDLRLDASDLTAIEGKT